jgi:hypothetical protein
VWLRVSQCGHCYGHHLRRVPQKKLKSAYGQCLRAHRGAAGHTECIGGAEQTQYRDMSEASISEKFLGDFLQKGAKTKKEKTTNKI